MTSIEKIIIFIEDNVNKLFKEGGKVIEQKTIDRSDILEIIDSIPAGLIQNSEGNRRPKVDMEVQTEQSFNVAGDSNLMLSTTKLGRGKRRSSVRVGSINLNPLLKAMNKYTSNKKDKVGPMIESNAYKLIGNFWVISCFRKFT